MHELEAEVAFPILRAHATHTRVRHAYATQTLLEHSDHRAVAEAPEHTKPMTRKYLMVASCHSERCPAGLRAAASAFMRPINQSRCSGLSQHRARDRTLVGEANADGYKFDRAWTSP